MKKEINLEELLNEISNINLDEDGNRIYYLWEVKKFAKVLCGKLLDLAAENAYTKEIEVAESIHGGPSYTYEIVDADSILQIKAWIK